MYASKASEGDVGQSRSGVGVTFEKLKPELIKSRRLRSPGYDMNLIYRSEEHYCP